MTPYSSTPYSVTLGLLLVYAISKEIVAHSSYHYSNMNILDEFNEFDINFDDFSSILGECKLA